MSWKDDPEYRTMLLELEMDKKDIRRLRRRSREYRNARLAAELASAISSKKKPSTETLREWRSLSELDQYRAVDSLELPERRSGGLILSFGPPREENDR